VTQLGIFGGKAANHLLLNEYRPGQGIMPHLGKQLTVCERTWGCKVKSKIVDILLVNLDLGRIRLDPEPHQLLEGFDKYSTITQRCQ
jgi:hypothetical protein